MPFNFSKFKHDLLEYTACPLCGADQPRSSKQFIFEPFRVVQCTNCQLWYLSPRLRESEMLQIYADPNYFEGKNQPGYSQPQGSYFDQEISKRLTFRKFLWQLQQRGMTGGHLLEIGCGYGWLLEEAAPLFDSLTGTDFNNEAVKQVKQLGYQAIQGGIEALPTKQRYNSIILTDVIEHIYEPVPFIQRLREHLSTTGWLILATPQMNSFWFKLQGKNWPSFKIPEHVTYYDQPTLTELFNRCGATQTVKLSYPHAFPLGMISAQLGLSLPAKLAKYPLWLPATTLAMAARFDIS